MAGNKPFNKQQTDARERDPQVAGLKVPPHSIEAEQSVLGGLMLDNERWDDVAERVVAEDFYTRSRWKFRDNWTASAVLLTWLSCLKTRQVRRTLALMRISSANAPLFVT